MSSGTETGTNETESGLPSTQSGSPTQPLPPGQTLWYSVANIGYGMFYALNNAALPLFLEQYTKDARILSLMSSSDSIEGVVVQPLVGASSDRLRTRLGRRRPFMLFAVPLAVVFMLFFGTVLPWLVYLLAGELVARFPEFMRFKGADYWLAPERHAATVASLRAFGAVFATFVALIVASAHVAVLEAHRRTPPTLAEAPFVAGVAVFVIGVIAVAIRYARRFRVPTQRRA